MKKQIIFIITFSFLLCANKINAQIKKIENNNPVSIGKSSSVELIRKVDVYYLNYQDVASSNLNVFRTIMFKDVDNAVGFLKKTLLENIDNKPEQSLLLEFPKDIVELVFERNYNTNTVQIVQKSKSTGKVIGKTHFLSKQDVNEIFR